jgi:hypothetical protein
MMLRVQLSDKLYERCKSGLEFMMSLVSLLLVLSAIILFFWGIS